MESRLSPKKILGLFKETYSEWSDDRAFSLGAALSYYTVFSLPSLLLIVLAIISFAFGKEAAEGQILKEFQGLMGEQTAGIIKTMLEAGAGPKNTAIAAGIGIAVLLFGATGVFGELQTALNSMWGVKPKPQANIKYIIRTRLISFSMVLVIGFLLLVSLVISAFLSSLGDYLKGLFSGATLLTYTLYGFDMAVSLGVITVLFAMVFKMLPDAKIAWGDVWMGSFVTAILFTIGKFLIGFYIGKSNIASAYGTAGSLVLILLWIYYSSLILYFGAEFTQVYANKYGSKIKPAEYAEPVEDSEARRKSA